MRPFFDEGSPVENTPRAVLQKNDYTSTLLLITIYFIIILIIW